MWTPRTARKILISIYSKVGKPPFTQEKKKRHFNHFDNVKLIRGKYSLGSINQLIRAKPPVEEEGTATLNTEEEEPVGSE